MTTRTRTAATLLGTAAAAAAIGLTIAAPPQPTFGAALKRPVNTQNDNSQGNNNNQGEQQPAPILRRPPVF